MKEFYLIRHGQSRANAGFPAVSPYEEALTELGQKQAEITATHLTKTPDIIVTSTYLRTHQTSAPTREKFSNTKHEIWPIEEFHQLTPGMEHGLTIEKMIPLFNDHWGRYDPHHSNGEGSESWAGILSRVDAFEDHLKKTPAKLLYAFSHGFFIKTFLVKHALGNTELAMNMKGLDHLMNGVFWVGNCAITRGIVTDDGQILVGRYSNHHIPEEMRT